MRISPVKYLSCNVAKWGDLDPAHQIEVDLDPDHQLQVDLDPDHQVEVNLDPDHQLQVDLDPDHQLEDDPCSAVLKLFIFDKIKKNYKVLTK